MRYFKASKELLDSMRQQVMVMLSMPNDRAIQPWESGATSLALCPHEYSPPEFEQLIEYALANGGQEITREQYDDLQPKAELP